MKTDPITPNGTTGRIGETDDNLKKFEGLTDRKIIRRQVKHLVGLYGIR